MANQMAVKQLDKIEHDYPVVRKSPNEVSSFTLHPASAQYYSLFMFQLWMASKDYYEHSRLKTNIDKVNFACLSYYISTEDFLDFQISGTKKYYQDALSHKLDTLLDFSDSLVDKYVAVHSEANGQPPQCGKIIQCFLCSSILLIDYIHCFFSDANGTYFKRVQCISGKAYFGVKHQAGEKYEATKQYALQMLGDLHLAMFLVS